MKELLIKNIENTSGNITAALEQDTPEKRSHRATFEESPAKTLPAIVQHDNETFSLSTEVSPAVTAVLPLETALTVASFFAQSTITFEEQIQKFKNQPQEKVIEDINKLDVAGKLVEKITGSEQEKRLVALQETKNYDSRRIFIKDNFTFSYISTARYIQITKRVLHLAPVQILEYF